MERLEQALRDLAAGKMIVLTDDENRENEGDLVMDAAAVTKEAVNFMVTHGRGLVCVPMEATDLEKLGIAPMTSRNRDRHQTAFSVSVDHRDCSTGISAADRALTIQALSDAASLSADFRQPGHIFPLEARDGGVLVRRGHTEASLDLVRLARARKTLKTGAAAEAGAATGTVAEAADKTRLSAIICEVMDEDGSMARGPKLEDFAAKHNLAMLSIEELVQYQRLHKAIVRRDAETVLPTDFGRFRLYGYTEIYTGREHVALVMGDVRDGKPVLCRVHSECLTGDALGSHRCDCGQQYREAMRRIAAEGRGILVYLRQEGRGIGLVNKIKAYALQDGGMDTVDANVHLGFKPDERDYTVGVQILKDLGAQQLRLMTNNPEKIEGLAAYGISVSGREPIIIPPNETNSFYMQTKALRMNHQLTEEL